MKGRVTESVAAESGPTGVGDTATQAELERVKVKEEENKTRLHRLDSEGMRRAWDHWTWGGLSTARFGGGQITLPTWSLSARVGGGGVGGVALSPSGQGLTHSPCHCH